MASSGSTRVSSSSASLIRASSLALTGFFQVIERDRSDVIAATFFRAVACTRVIDDEPSHHARSIGHEVSAVRKRVVGTLGHVQVGLVQQSGGAEAPRNKLAG